MNKDARIQELEAEVERLKTANRKLRDKLSAANRKINRAWRDSYESVDFHDDRR
jgi:outer membrane murein-binding lipoprotein Lpp